MERKFLGDELWLAKGWEVKHAVARKAVDTFKARIRPHRRRSGGRSMEPVVQRLRPDMLGSKAYFGLAQTSKAWRKLGGWLRHRVRAIQPEHWGRPTTMYRELKALGAGEVVARRVAANSRRRSRNGDHLRTRTPGGAAGAPPGMEAPCRSWTTTAVALDMHSKKPAEAGFVDQAGIPAGGQITSA